MKIKWYGHSSFGITTAAGVTIITDPYTVGGYDGALAYKGGWPRADVVLQSHTHPDHTGGKVPGNPVVIATSGAHQVKGITFRGVVTGHDASGGRERGANNVFAFEADGLKVAFMGDLGHVLSAAQVDEIGAVDVLFVPVGGHFTIDAAAATKVAEQLKARVVIPMHYRTPAIDFPIAPVDEFLKGKPKVDRVGAGEVELTAATLDGPRVVVLDYVG